MRNMQVDWMGRRSSIRCETLHPMEEPKFRLLIALLRITGKPKAGRHSLFWHNINRGGQVHGSFFMWPNHQVLVATAITRENCGFSPIQIPAIFDSNHRVRAGAYVEKSKTAIEIGLVAAEEIVIRFRILRDQHYH